MSEKILFVDDEQSLLNGIVRRLGEEFDLSTALSGADALEAMRSEGPFHVVVTDMRMPKMDGVEYVKRAREIAPDTVYVMLTGNQDQATAIRALNEGQVFRFLNKPCKSDELRRVLVSALRQYELVTVEKELLHKTFVGAVTLLTDVLDISQPDVFGRCRRVAGIVETLIRETGIADHWEFKLASKLSLLGFGILPSHEIACFSSHQVTDANAIASYQRASATAAKLVDKIPRLKNVAKIIEMQVGSQGGICSMKPTSDGAVAQVGATLLRVAVAWECLTSQGLCNSEALTEMKEALPELDVNLAAALTNLTEEREDEAVQVPVDELKPSMVLAARVMTPDGSILMREGRRLTTESIGKLHDQASDGGLRPIEISKCSIPYSDSIAKAMAGSA